MKKLKTWQKVLLIIFYPVGIVYFIIWLYRTKIGGAVIAEKVCSVWGTIYQNENGTHRQTYIAKLKVGEDLLFKPAPTQEYPDTIGVFTKRGEQIGFIGYKDLNELRGLYAHNRASVTVESVEHSERGLGVTMRIKIYK